jgi:predicted amidohydrolase YtcJ
MKLGPKAFPLLTVVAFTLIPGTSSSSDFADLILTNGEVYTMEADQPWASTVVITGNTITAVLNEGEDAKQWIGLDTRVVDLEGKFVVPGFIDSHTHFSSVGRFIIDANLMHVSDRQSLRAELQRVVALLDKGEWITGGLWGAYETSEEPWKPHRSMIDDITTEHPCLLNNYNRTLFLANTAALRAAGLEGTVLEGMEVDANGRPTGLIHARGRDLSVGDSRDLGSPAIEKIRDVIKPKSHERLLDENRAGLKALREAGIVEIHDVTDAEQTARFVELQEKGELTCRVWMRPDLGRAPEMKEKGFRMGLHPKTSKPDPWLRYGALKGYLDGLVEGHGALMFEPYPSTDDYGHYRHNSSDDPDYKTENMEKMYNLIKVGYEAGFVSNIHAIGTKGVDLLLDTYERLMRDLGRDLEGFRIIHAQTIRPCDLPRFSKLNIIAEVNPYHLSDEIERYLEDELGPKRFLWSYDFKSLQDNGATLTFGSDIPGIWTSLYLGRHYPKYLINGAVNRTTIEGTPEGGWQPEERLSMHEALKAYTINAAYAAFEADTRGSIKPGKLADITVCDLNLLEIDPKDILKMNIEMTIVDGKIVYERNN